MSTVRDLPLALARCCTLYVVSVSHLVPACRECGLTPSYECDITLDELSGPKVRANLK